METIVALYFVSVAGTLVVCIFGSGARWMIDKLFSFDRPRWLELLAEMLNE